MVPLVPCWAVGNFKCRNRCPLQHHSDSSLVKLLFSPPPSFTFASLGDITTLGLQRYLLYVPHQSSEGALGFGAPLDGNLEA